MLYLTSEDELNFNKEVQALYFYASWMPYHKKMITMISKMEEKYKEFDFFAIDVDYFKSFIKRFEIESIPTVILFKNKEEVKKIQGLPLTSALRTVFADICKS
jgi:thioredoxin-like negative regulator of GroEL